MRAPAAGGNALRLYEDRLPDETDGTDENGKRSAAEPFHGDRFGSWAGKFWTVCWWLMLASSVGLGLWRWKENLRWEGARWSQPDSGVDGSLQAHLGIEHGAAALRKEIDSLPTNAPLLVVGPGNDWTLSEVYFLISYLGWPRPVWSVGVMPGGQKARYDNPPPTGFKPVKIFVYKMSPPPGVAAHALSKDLAVVQVTK